MDIKYGYCFKHNISYPIYFKGVKCPQCHKEDYPAEKNIFELGTLPEEVRDKISDIPVGYYQEPTTDPDQLDAVLTESHAKFHEGFIAGKGMLFVSGPEISINPILPDVQTDDEPCGYCGDINDPEVVCTKCWNDMHQKEKDEQFAQFLNEVSVIVTNGLKIPNKLFNLQPWELVDFPHFRAVRHRKGDWTHIFLKPTGQEIDLEKLGKKVILHSNGIEWLDD